MTIQNIQSICEILLLLHEHGSAKEQMLLKGHTADQYSSIYFLFACGTPKPDIVQITSTSSANTR